MSTLRLDHVSFCCEVLITFNQVGLNVRITFILLLVFQDEHLLD